MNQDCKFELKPKKSRLFCRTRENSVDYNLNQVRPACNSLSRRAPYPSYFCSHTSSVAGGGAGGGLEPPPIGLWTMQNRTFLVLLRPIFCEKLKIAPPIGKQPPLKRLNFRIWPKNLTKFRWRSFFFFFFFWRPPHFGRKKPLNFRAFREISSQFSDKPCETYSRTMKIRVKVDCTFLTLSK